MTGRISSRAAVRTTSSQFGGGERFKSAGGLLPRQATKRFRHQWSLTIVSSRVIITCGDNTVFGEFPPTFGLVALKQSPSPDH